MSGYTPKPWSAFTDDTSGPRPHTNIVSVVPVTDVVFSLPGMDKNDPNVRLITAAPDLLEASKGLLEWAEEYCKTGKCPTFDALHPVRCAIQKAEKA